MGILEVLTVAFIVLKLTGYIAWSWFWVLSPLIPALIIYTIMFGLMILSVVLK